MIIQNTVPNTAEDPRDPFTQVVSEVISEYSHTLALETVVISFQLCKGHRQGHCRNTGVAVDEPGSSGLKDKEMEGGGKISSVVEFEETDGSLKFHTISSPRTAW